MDRRNNGTQVSAVRRRAQELSCSASSSKGSGGISSSLDRGRDYPRTDLAAADDRRTDNTLVRSHTGVHATHRSTRANSRREGCRRRSPSSSEGGNAMRARRKDRKKFLDASLVPMENALLARAEELERSSAEWNQETVPRNIYAVLADQFRKLAEELHHWL